MDIFVYAAWVYAITACVLAVVTSVMYFKIDALKRELELHQNNGTKAL